MTHQRGYIFCVGEAVTARDDEHLRSPSPTLSEYIVSSDESGDELDEEATQSDEEQDPWTPPVDLILSPITPLTWLSPGPSESSAGIIHLWSIINTFPWIICLPFWAIFQFMDNAYTCHTQASVHACHPLTHLLPYLPTETLKMRVRLAWTPHPSRNLILMLVQLHIDLESLECVDKGELEAVDVLEATGAPYRLPPHHKVEDVDVAMDVGEEKDKVDVCPQLYQGAE